MGCGASLPKPCTPDQKATLCAAMGKEMMRICVKPTLATACSKTDFKLKIPAPPEVARLRKDVENLRKGAKEWKDQMLDAGKDAAAATAPVAAKPAGMMSGLMNAGKELAGKATEAVAGAAGDVAEATLNTMADQLEKLINTIEEPFEKVGQEIVIEKRDKIEAVLEAYIANLALKASGQAVELVRGAEPHGPAEYDKVEDALTDFLFRKSAKNLFAQLHPICQEAIKAHAITKIWNNVIETWNSLCKSIGAIEIAKKNNLVPQPIELDIDEYIVEQCIEQLATIMGKKEKAIRKEGFGVDGNVYVEIFECKNPQTFVDVFDGDKALTEPVLKFFESGKDTPIPPLDGPYPK